MKKRQVLTPYSEDHCDKHTKSCYHHTDLLLQNENSETEQVPTIIAACSPSLRGAGHQSTVLMSSSATHKCWTRSGISGTHVWQEASWHAAERKVKYKVDTDNWWSPLVHVGEKSVWKYIQLSTTSSEHCPELPASLCKGSSSQRRHRDGNHTWGEMSKTHAAQSSLDLSFSDRPAWLHQSLYFPYSQPWISTGMPEAEPNQAAGLRNLKHTHGPGTSEVSPNVLGQIGSQLAAAGDPSPKNRHNLEIIFSFKIFSLIFLMLIGSTLSTHKAGS